MKSTNWLATTTRVVRRWAGVLLLTLPLLVQGAAVHDAQWIIRQPQQAFTLQLITLSSQAQAERFISNEVSTRQHPVAIFRYQKKQRLLYVVTMGVFMDADSAQQVKEALRLQSVAADQAWIRPIDEVQAQIRTTLQN